MEQEAKMKIPSYRILLREEPEGGYTVIVPSLPGCVTYGDSVEEAIEMAKEAIELYVESLKEHSEEIPKGRIKIEKPPGCRRLFVSDDFNHRDFWEV